CTIDLDGPVHYADFGGTGPTLVLVHGLGGSHVNWMAVAPALARDARVLAVDLAGFGRTPLGERSADVHANRILLDRFLEGVAAGPAVLVGNSMGGLVAMMEAALAPERVAGLVLVAPAQPRSAEARMDGRVAALFLYALPVLVQGDRDRLVAPAASRRLAELRPDWSFELFADVGHVPQLEEPARFVGSVERWLAARAPAAASR